MNSNTVPEFDFASHVQSHLFLYVRLVLLIVSWLFVAYEPFIFLSTLMFTVALGFADKFITSFSVPSAVRDMLFQILEKITSSMLLFAVLSKMKTKVPGEEMGYPSFVWVSIFILDFVSSWFRVYSVYLAGPRTAKVSNAIENVIIGFYRSSLLGNFLITLLAEVWVATYMIEYSSKSSALYQYSIHELFVIVR